MVQEARRGLTMFYRSIMRPLLFRLPSETAHEIGLKTLSIGFSPKFVRSIAANRLSLSPFGPIKRFGLTFANPVGIAAGFDKNGLVAQALEALGFGFVEVGTVTFHPQPGNPKPRLFRLPKDEALINRAGFNNEGATCLVQRLEKRRPSCVLGINIGKSKIVELENAVEDYLASFEIVYPRADYIAVNVSSPNTPNLRELQRANALAALLDALQKRNQELAVKRGKENSLPLLVKIAPDLDQSNLEEIVGVALEKNLSGIIATNTTVSREGLSSAQREIEACGQGGLSGGPLRRRSTEIISEIYRLTKGVLPIIGVGGIFTAEDAWEKISAGACLVQLYTGLIYEGPSIARKINEGLFEILNKQGIKSFDEAVGCENKLKNQKAKGKLQIASMD
jgi:dihydroorotate dehydrogenase